MSGMKIVMVSNHSCIRVHKIAIPLFDRGYDVHLIAKKPSTFAPQYKTFTHFYHVDQCLDSIRLHARDADIFHCHNEPSWFVCAVKELTDKPVILDVHDTYLTRSTAEEAREALDDGKPHVYVTNEERNSMQIADAINFVSEPVREVCEREFKLEVPSNVLPSYVPASLYRYEFQVWFGGLVYEGRATLPEQYENLKGGTGSHYCDYRDIAKEAKELGIDFHLYSGKEDKRFLEVYGDLCHVHPGFAYSDLLNHISRHDWGLVGNTVKNTQWNAAMPNKLFDYMAAGVPSVVIGASESAKLVEEYGFGIVVKNLKELAERWGEHRQCREKLFKCRQELSMDHHIHNLENLYREVL